MSPFGKYAGIIAAAAALMVLTAWLITQLFPGIPSSDGLNAAALLVMGAIFGTGAGALVVANGAGKIGDVANARLDAIGAPSAPAAAAINKAKEESNG